MPTSVHATISHCDSHIVVAPASNEARAVPSNIPVIKDSIWNIWERFFVLRKTAWHMDTSIYLFPNVYDIPPLFSFFSKEASRNGIAHFVTIVAHQTNPFNFRHFTPPLDRRQIDISSFSARTLPGPLKTTSKASTTVMEDIMDDDGGIMASTSKQGLV
ncbi:hypothetical protein M422DRAFT_249800 [Sphaerobolus stellatus SS14]|uniref:Uncharacterized protein n=1 Tax=Sphaerobolus stellatus (strain SS14) TaxID=990650 RepID=A0A0C9VUM6_SPHS4|nr:hypothetical protein M422DRAFT_249800 [Sphaerobolus stellatus SS14]